MTRQLQCFAEGEGDKWHAICLDYDLAVQGRSFQEVGAALDSAIADYLKAAAQEDDAVRRRLLYRSAPLPIRVLYAWRFFAHYVFGRNSGRSYHGYQTVCPA